MKTVIYYFSGTGNSLMVARDISNKLGDTSVIPMTSLKEKGLKYSGDRIGIVFPVYIWGLPETVKSFINELNKTKDQTYIFAVATCKSQPGGALMQLNKLLASRGMKLSAGFNVYMPGNNTPYYEPDSIENRNTKFKMWEKRLDEVILHIKNEKQNKIESGSFITKVIGTRVLHGLITSTFHQADKQFYTDQKCSGCGTCVKLCPVQNIKMIENRPEWQHNCEQCVSCINLCPRQSIQFRKGTINRPRYKNPFVDIEDLIF